MTLALGIIIGILLSIIALLGGKKLHKELEKIERQKMAEEHPQQMAQVIRLEDRVKELLKDE